MKKNIEDIVRMLPEPIWLETKRQTDVVLVPQHPDDANYFKFVFLHQMNRPFRPISEWHIRIDWRNETGYQIEQKLRDIMHVVLSPEAKASIGFAAFEIGPNDTLFQKTSTFNDKVYFTFTDNGLIAAPEEWLKYYETIWKIVEDDFRCYVALCDHFSTKTAQKEYSQWNDFDWKIITLLRNLLAVFCENHIEERISNITETLLQTLETAIRSDRPEVAYHCANILEWISYGYPETFSLPYGKHLIEKFCELHLQAAEIESWPIRVRFETIWSIGWANVALPPIAALSVSELHMLEQSEEVSSSPVFWAIVRMAWARGLFRQAYHDTAQEDKAGAFSRLLDDIKRPRPQDAEAYLQDIIHQMKTRQDH